MSLQNHQNVLYDLYLRNNYCNLDLNSFSDLHLIHDIAVGLPSIL